MSIRIEDIRDFMRGVVDVVIRGSSLDARADAMDKAAREAGAKNGEGKWVDGFEEREEKRNRRR